MVDETFQQIRRTIKSSPPVLARDEDVAMSPSDLTQTDSHPPPEHCGQQYQEDFEVSFERRVFGVQQQMLEEVKSGMETLAGTLEGVRMCLSPNKGITEAIRDTHSWLHGIDDSLSDIAGVMIAKSKQPQSCSSCSSDVVEQLGVINSSIHSFHHGVESKLDSFINTMSALNSNVVAVLENQQSLARDFNATFKALTNILSTLHPTSSSSADSALVAGRSMSAPQLQPTPLPEEHAESEDEEVVFPTLRGRFLR